MLTHAKNLHPTLFGGVAVFAAASIAYATPRQTAYDTATVHYQNSTTDIVTPSIEVTAPASSTTDYDYLPNVVQSEDGAGPLAALEAQAISARSFLYYKLTTQGYIGDGQNDQVYSGYNFGDPTALQRLAVSLTDRIVLRYGNGTNDQTIAGFFVAGATPTSSNGLPFGEASGSGTGGTQVDVTYNRGLTGNNITQTQLGYVTSPPSGNVLNRGALSQNGANYLASNGTDNFDYADILRYFYGADIHMEVAAPSSSTDLQPALTVENFDTDQGFFGNGVLSSKNVNVSSVARTESTDSHSAAVAAGQPKGSQQIAITDARAAGLPTQFTFDDVSGLGPNSITQADGSTAGQGVVGTAATNLSMPSIGSISYWLKVTSATSAVGLTTDILLNNDAGTLQTSSSDAVTDDGAWHQYSFFVNDPTEFLTNFDTGSTSSYFSINSIGLSGLGDATFELDDVVYIQQAVESLVPEPTTLLALGAALGLPLFRRRRA